MQLQAGVRDLPEEEPFGWGQYPGARVQMQGLVCVVAEKRDVLVDSEHVVEVDHVQETLTWTATPKLRRVLSPPRWTEILQTREERTSLVHLSQARV